MGGFYGECSLTCTGIVDEGVAASIVKGFWGAQCDVKIVWGPPVLSVNVNIYLLLHDLKGTIISKSPLSIIVH